MKNILKYTFASLVALASLASCEENVDYQQTVGVPQKRVYAYVGTNNAFITKVVHTPIGSIGDFIAEFPLRYNTTVHETVVASLSYDASLAEAYNTQYGTAYAVLPENYLVLENTTLTIPEGEIFSTDSVKVTLTGTYSVLTNKNGYIAPIRISSTEAKTSEMAGVVYIVVNTEESIIRPVTSTADMYGTTATRTGWTATGTGTNPANMFDGSTSTYYQCPGPYNNVMIVDMVSVRKLTGFNLRHYNTTSVNSIPTIGIEYSTDGTNYSQVGTADANNSFSTSDYYRHVAFYGTINARYLRLTLNYVTTTSSNLRVYEFNAFESESDSPLIYVATGTNNVVSSEVIHSPVGSFSKVNVRFPVRCTQPTQTGYSVSVAGDNSLIASYNAANGTSYVALPDGYLQIGNIPCAIGSMKYTSDKEVVVTLTGDMTKLTATGYLVPLKLSASGTAISANQGVVYLIITPANNNFRTSPTAANITGTLVEARTGWTVTNASNGASLGTTAIDGSVTTYIANATKYITFNFGQNNTITGLRFYSRNAANSANYLFTSILIETSTNGTTYTSQGLCNSSYLLAVDGYQTCIPYSAITARYVRVTVTGSYSIAEFDIYVQ